MKNFNLFFKKNLFKSFILLSFIGFNLLNASDSLTEEEVRSKIQKTLSGIEVRMSKETIDSFIDNAIAYLKDPITGFSNTKLESFLEETIDLNTRGLNKFIAEFKRGKIFPFEGILGFYSVATNMLIHLLINNDIIRKEFGLYDPDKILYALNEGYQIGKNTFLLEKAINSLNFFLGNHELTTTNQLIEKRNEKIQKEEKPKKVLQKYQKEFPDLSSNINQQDKEGKTLLRVASENRDNEAVLIALDLGADPKISATDGATVLHVTAEHNLVEPMQLILAKHPEVVDYQGNRGATPLRIAVENARNEAAKILLDSGANPNIKGSDGLSAADILKQGIGRSSKLAQDVRDRILKS